ncbi:MAG: glycosyltransferase family 2 protein [Armatimonadota bacterium]
MSDPRQGGDPRISATVLVPSYKRPDRLLRCLEAVLAGSRLPDQIVVVLRDTDEDSGRRLREWLTRCEHRGLIEMVEVVEPGQVAATNRGLEVARGDVVCFIDDDAEPEETWLARILAHYHEPSVAGVGGRDIVHHDEEISARPRPAVGRLTWFGRIVGNHHQPAFSEPREVDHLKGANMSFRREAIAGFDPNIMGAHFTDTDASLSARRSGGRLIYDPSVRVHHYPAPRPTGYGRQAERPEEIHADAHDWSYVMLKHLSAPGRAAFWGFALSVGQGRRYGLLRMLARLPAEGTAAIRRWWHTLRGLLDGAATCWASRRHRTPDRT